MLKLILIVLVVFGAIAAMKAFFPGVMTAQAFAMGGVSVTFGLLIAVGFLVLAVKNIA